MKCDEGFRSLTVEERMITGIITEITRGINETIQKLRKKLRR